MSGNTIFATQFSTTLNPLYANQGDSQKVSAIIHTVISQWHFMHFPFLLHLQFRKDHYVKLSFLISCFDLDWILLILLRKWHHHFLRLGLHLLHVFIMNSVCWWSVYHLNNAQILLSSFSQPAAADQMFAEKAQLKWEYVGNILCFIDAITSLRLIDSPA